MRFHFSTYNHSEVGKRTILDMFSWLRAGLEEVGHEVTFSSDTVDPSAINIFWEYFVPAELGTQLASSGLVYGIIVTEFIDGEGFNRGTPWSAAQDRRDGDYRARWDGFLAAARGTTFFWTMVESNLDYLRQLAPASFVELGYSERLVPKSTVEPSIDFSFTGEMTPHRARLLEDLEKRAQVFWYHDFLRVEDRDKLFLATRINLSPNKTVDWEMPSPTRVGMALLSKRGIALDRTPQQTRQSRLVESCPEGMGFIDFALSQLTSDWRHAAEIGFERYKAELPMKTVVERLLDECLLKLPQFGPAPKRQTGAEMDDDQLEPPRSLEAERGATAEIALAATEPGAPAATGAAMTKDERAFADATAGHGLGDQRGSAAPGDLASTDTVRAAWRAYERRLSLQAAQALGSFAPNFLIIGPPKTATTWLYQVLRQDTRFLLPEKELFFFSHLWREFPLASYYAKFRGSLGAAWRGEASPTYFILPSVAIAAVRRALPDVKLIVTLRDPAERAWSHARHAFRYRENGFFSRGEGSIEDLADAAWAAELLHPRARSYQDYAEPLTRWTHFFPEEQILILPAEQIATEPQQVIEKVYAFLGADFPRAVNSLHERPNPGLRLAVPDAVAPLLDVIGAACTARLSEIAKTASPRLREQLLAAIPFWHSRNSAIAPEKLPKLADAPSAPHWDALTRREFPQRLLSWTARSTRPPRDGELLHMAALNFEYYSLPLDRVAEVMESAEPKRYARLPPLTRVAVSMGLSEMGNGPIAERQEFVPLKTAEPRVESPEESPAGLVEGGVNGYNIGSRGDPFYALAQSLSPQATRLLVNGYKNTRYNIALFGGKYYAVGQEEGPIDLQNINDRSTARPVYVGRSLNEVTARIDAAENGRD